ncbi:MAG: polysaccharide deacetylase family protein, partial [Prevotella sp.]|nr:polysaccharide deacetylase family protein [Prevotella sp.]
MIIEQPAIYLRWLYPGALWRMDRRERSVYLTFDDGPIPESTPFILDTLRQRRVKATFFMVGDNVRKYPELYRQIVEQGHRVGNHTHNHISGFRHSIHDYSYNV